MRKIFYLIFFFLSLVFFGFQIESLYFFSFFNAFRELSLRPDSSDKEVRYESKGVTNPYKNIIL